ncbi:FusB/FusC family EF-G-binding protein [Paenibacillus popilliae]|uniref:FusB/FusC family EF-G-binding protein n=1 Tax=Paenibacillus popilliae TaxID=78057 RepID=UPI0005A98DF2|nr:elongation factor G-binding protein [Paenibacillus popilliae]
MLFIKPHELNFIRKQLNYLIQTVYFVGDYRTLRATEEEVEYKIGEVIRHLDPEIRNLFTNIRRFRGQDEVIHLLESLSPYVEKFPNMTTKQVRQLFPRVKSFCIPDFEKLADVTLAYLGWKDISTNSLYLIYHEDGKLYTVECRYTPLSGRKTCFCCLCNQSRTGSQIGLVTTKRRKELVTGNYMCLNSQQCNNDITDIHKLKEFLVV